MLFVGIDPDLHCTAWGTWENGKPRSAGVIETKKVKGRIEQAAVLDMVNAIGEGFSDVPVGAFNDSVFAVEAQTLHVTGLKQHKRPQDIVTLGNVAGALLAHCVENNGIGRVMFPTAREWKGQIPKAVMQARFYTEIGWGYKIIGKSKTRPHGDHAVPLDWPLSFNNIKLTQWKHVGDSLMLAKWVSENWKQQ